MGNNVAGEASLVVNGGEIIAPISSDNSAAINLGSANAAGNTVEINGGKITGYNGVRLYGNGEKGMTVLTMNGGSISAVNAGIYNQLQKELKIQKSIYMEEALLLKTMQKLLD